MKTGKPGRWVREDAPARRLLEEIGASDLEYYSAREDRAVTDALKSWPLLAAVSRALAAAQPGIVRLPAEIDAPLRVVEHMEHPTPSREEK